MSGYFLLGEILFTWRVQWPFEPLYSGLLVWDRVCFITLFVIFHIDEPLGLIQALAEHGMIGVLAVAAGLSLDFWTSGMGRKSFQTTIPILFD